MIELFLFRKKELLLGGTAVLMFAFALIAYATSGPSAETYLRAEVAYSAWLSEPKDEAKYTAMEAAFHKAPALKKKYEPAIAQKLLSLGRTEEALKIARGILARSQGVAPLHAAFAAGSLLIEQGAYQQALEHAVALKEQMKGPQHPILYAQLLIRIATLQQELKNQPGERAAWEEFRAYAESTPGALDPVLGSFAEKQVGLMHYIAERQKVLGG